MGIVLVSHSGLLADGLAELLAQLGAASVPVAAAGGTDDGGIGTSVAKVEKAIRSVDRGAGVVLVPDLGSSVLTAKTLLASGLADLPEPLAIADVPFVEGAVSAAVIAGTGPTSTPCSPPPRKPEQLASFDPAAGGPDPDPRPSLARGVGAALSGLRERKLVKRRQRMRR